MNPKKYFIVIGNPIAHSQSPLIHHAFAKQTGQNICYQRQFCPDNYDSFVAVVSAFFCGGGMGANITLPFKEMAYQLCNTTGQLSDEARLAGAVNTLMMIDGKLFGDNTDGKGLVYDLTTVLSAHKLGDLTQKKVLILGAGGASRGVILPLLQAGVAHISIANRTYDKAVNLVANFTDYQDQLSPLALNKLTEHLATKNTPTFDIIINATSATTHAQNLTLPKTLHTQVAYDMAYGKPSAFLTHFNNNAITQDGLGMLVAQAAFSFMHWTNTPISQLNLDDVMTKLHAKIPTHHHSY